MSSYKATKLVTVPSNGQISIGKSWAGRQVKVEVSETEIHISAGTFIPDSQKQYFTPEANAALNEFNAFERSPAKATNTRALFSALKKKKQVRGK